MKKTKLLGFFLLSCGFSTVYSQSFQSQPYYGNAPIYYEIGGGMGAMNCITDLGGAANEKFYINEIKGRNYKFSGSIYASAIYHNFIGARLEATSGQVSSADRDVEGNSMTAVYKRNRNLSFSSKIKELSLLFEFHPLPLFDLEPKKWWPEPYILAGIGLFSFNPQTKYNGNMVDLKPLHTEGEGFPEYPAVSNYSLTQANIPVGFGLRYKLTSRVNLRLEYIHRKLFTDYLDDASSKKYVDPVTFDKNLSPELAALAKALYNPSLNGRNPPRRGDPGDKDVFMTLFIKIGVSLFQ
jgi:hypothetical protein